ncbi:MAG: DUF2628 domain-containing protein [Nitrospiraceae bacterium]|nr:DUF2628 domain-containing protein [Nitrospiraceae bacterium]
MKTFNVYRHPIQGLEAVKVGFSWPAASAGPIWMLGKQLWGWSALWIALYVSLSLVETDTDTSELGGAQALVYLHLVAGYAALSLIPGLKGNQWREKNLVRRGFEMLGTVQAETSEAAISQMAMPP